MNKWKLRKKTNLKGKKKRKEKRRRKLRKKMTKQRRLKVRERVLKGQRKKEREMARSFLDVGFQDVLLTWMTCSLSTLLLRRDWSLSTFFSQNSWN
jgi:hypothetical protein